MPWFRVLLESRGLIRESENSEWIGAFSTRNVEASDADEARRTAEVHVDSELLDYAARQDEPPKANTLEVRSVEGPLEKAAGFAFFDGAAGSREAALRIERPVFDAAPKPASLLRRLWRRITSP